MSFLGAKPRKSQRCHKWPESLPKVFTKGVSPEIYLPQFWKMSLPKVFTKKFCPDSIKYQNIPGSLFSVPGPGYLFII